MLEKAGHGAMVHSCNPSAWEVDTGGSLGLTEARHSSLLLGSGLLKDPGGWCSRN